MTHSNVPSTGKRWLIPPIITLEAETALRAFPPALRQILYNRGYATDAEARAFLKAEPDFDTDPFQMTGSRRRAHQPGAGTGRTDCHLWRLRCGRRHVHRAAGGCADRSRQ